MKEMHDPNVTADIPSSVPADSLDAGLVAGFGGPAAAPRSSLGDLRPVLLKEAEGESSHVVKPKSDAMPSPAEAGDRYQLSGEIARGGMGAVLRGRDVDLGRDLAIKVLLEKYVDRPEIARRFIEEAQIGGQLQHPGVVPVYDIGRFGDRPFFTMKLVKGQTLAALLGERRTSVPLVPGDGDKRDACPTAADRARFLAIALQVAQTLAYAHAKGVIHRDLKPANVMVGAFGEVQVMDWGLAKILAEGGIADEEKSRARQQVEDVTTIRTARSTGSAGSYGTDTEAGSLLGTPAYMPPEQANGDVTLLDRRADVFGLGAILCEILTGQPPYVGRSYEEVRRKAANGDLAETITRLAVCGADQELIALTKQCLAPETIDRPKDAQAVANGLSAYLNGVQERLQSAERERAVAVVREAEQRKKRKVQLALAAAVVGLLLGGGAFAFWRNEQAQTGRERDARNAEAVAALLGQAEESLKANDAAKAAVVLEAAKQRTGEGGAGEHADWLGRLDLDLALVRDLDAVDQFRWTWIEHLLPDPAVVAARTREALGRFGADPDAVSVDEAAARVSASPVRDRLVSALDYLLRHQKWAGARAVLQQVDADPFRDAIRNAYLAEDTAKKLTELAGQPAALEQPPGFAASMGLSKEIGVERRRQLLQAAVSRRPGDLGLLMSLGISYPHNQKDGADERLRWYQAAVAAAPGKAAAHNSLGVTLVDKGMWDDAIACFKKAIELDPKHNFAPTNLGVALAGKGQVDEAIACFRNVIEHDPKNASAHFGLGLALFDMGRLDEAIASYQTAIKLDPKYAKAHNNLGNALKAKGQLDEAIASHQKAIAAAPEDAVAHYNLGNALRLKGRLNEAIASYQQAIALSPNYATAHCNMGLALTSQGRFAESLAALKRGHELGSQQPGWRYPSAEWVRQAEAKVALEARLAAFFKGEFQPTDNQERLGLAGICQGQKLYHVATGLYAAAFAADPKLADDLQAQHRYTSACNAALAAGQGDDVVKLDDTERTRLRQQALDWLRADLARRAGQLESGLATDRTALLQQMRHWQQDPDLASLRDKDSLAKLPADEQTAFTRLWADVAALLKQAETSAAKEEKP